MSLATAAGFAVCRISFDAASGNETDTIGAKTATEVGTVPSATGLFSGGRDFERADTDGFTMSDHTDFRPNDGSYTITVWFNPESSDVGQTLVAKADGSNGTLFLLGTATGKASAQIYASSGFGGGHTIDSTGSLAAGWNLLIWKFDAAGEVLGISLNGAAFNTVGHTTGTYDSTEGIQIGFDSFGGRLDGILDDLVFVKGYAFSDADASELWNSGAGVVFDDWDAGGGGNPYYYYQQAG